MRRGPAVAALAACALVLAACSSGEDGSRPPGDTVTASPAPSARTKPGRPRVVGTIAAGLAVPWGLAFLPDGDAIVTERDTRRVLLIHGPRHEVREISRLGEPVGAGAEGESGLLGVAVSPDFATDHLLYFYVTTPSDNRIVRVAYEHGRLSDAFQVILDGIPHGYIHDGGRLAFGPDGYLYASTGDTGDESLAQDKDSLGGKILRITPDGDPAPGNPFGTPVFSYGHRNVQGLAFDDDGHLWASEFGHDLFDELNLVEAGHDYGWPVVEGRGDAAGMTNPQVVWDPSVASPSGLAWADGALWLGSLRGMRLWRIDVSGTRASDPTDFFVGRYGRMRTVAVAPDGRLWVTTSNRDGRGAPVAGDDRILLVSP